MVNKSILSMGGVLFLTIYVDQMFFENFIMNYIILYLTSKFSGKSVKWYRLAIGAVIGGIYVILSYIYNFYDTSLIIVKIALVCTIVLVSFEIKEVKDFCKLCVVFVGITFLIGGASFGLAFLFNFTTISAGGVLYVEEFPVIMLALGVAVTLVMIKWIEVFVKNRVRLKNFLYNVDINLFGSTINTVVLLDSGHNVKEKFSGYPVIILNEDIFAEMVPCEIIRKIKESNFDFEEKWRKRFRIINISTVSSKNDSLIGFIADKCVVHREEGNIVIDKIVVVSCDRILDKEGRYFGLIGNFFDDV